MDVVKGSHEHGNASAGDSEVLRARREFSVAAREAARCEREVELAVSRRQVPDGGGEEAARREVVGWEWHPGGCVRVIGDEAQSSSFNASARLCRFVSSRSGVRSMSRVS